MAVRPEGILLEEEDDDEGKEGQGARPHAHPNSTRTDSTNHLWLYVIHRINVYFITAPVLTELSDAFHSGRPGCICDSCTRPR